VVVRFAARLDGSAASDVVDFYEERRRSHRGHVRSREGGPSRRRRPQDASRKPLQCRSDPSQRCRPSSRRYAPCRFLMS
jgi:hypothetical protein